MSPAMRRPTENMLVRSNNDGTYSCNWTPGATGWYSLHVTIDGYQLEEVRFAGHVRSHLSKEKFTHIKRKKFVSVQYVTIHSN